MCIHVHAHTDPYPYMEDTCPFQQKQITYKGCVCLFSASDTVGTPYMLGTRIVCKLLNKSLLVCVNSAKHCNICKCLKFICICKFCT